MTDLDFTVTHLIVVSDDHAGAGRVFRAECSCGWSGDRHGDPASAGHDRDDHRMVAVGPADELDRSISRLLDLQDDLAQAVVWLAERWSADLPAPSAGSTGADGLGVVLSAYCLTPALLSRAAGALDAPVIDDPGPDDAGNRYQRAIRQFGRVRIEVFRRLDPDHQAAA
jgi:hypothetical protein